MGDGQNLLVWSEFSRLIRALRPFALEPRQWCAYKFWIGEVVRALTSLFSDLFSLRPILQPLALLLSLLTFRPATGTPEVPAWAQYGLRCALANGFL